MEKIIVWSKQHKSVWEELKRTGRYTAKRGYIKKDLEEHADLVLEVYDWYVKKVSKKYPKPEDAEYPVWVSMIHEATMLPSEGTVILELEIDKEDIMPVNISKWGTILNYSYLAKDEKDSIRHKELLKAYRTTDAKAYMTQFYPEIKNEIIKSWDLLFDDSILINKNNEKYGTIWEVRKEWIKNVIE